MEDTAMGGTEEVPVVKEERSPSDGLPLDETALDMGTTDEAGPTEAEPVGYQTKEDHTIVTKSEISTVQPQVLTDLSTIPTIESANFDTNVDAESNLTTTDMATVKKLKRSVKRKSNSRASSMDRSSPARSASVASGSGKLNIPTSAPAKRPAKKGIAVHKPAAKKRKSMAAPDSDDEGDATPATSRGSKTPLSRGGKHHGGSGSAANSPAHEQSASDDDEQVFCICRKPDDHNFMVGCDGGCEDWFHGRCVGVKPKEQDLMDSFICPNCASKTKKQTTYKPACRLPGCWSAARTDREEPARSSKYCSDAHAEEFFLKKLGKVEVGLSEKHPGSEMTVDEVKAILDKITSIEALNQLGDFTSVGAITAALSSMYGVEFESNNKLEMDDVKKIYELVPGVHKARLDTLISNYNKSEASIPEIELRQLFLKRVAERSKALVKVLQKRDPKLKNICGYDERLIWSVKELDDFRNTTEGAAVLRGEAILGPLRDDANGEDLEAEPDDEANIDKLTHGVCVRKPNSCNQHRNWESSNKISFNTELIVAEHDMKKVKMQVFNTLRQIVLNRDAK